MDAPGKACYILIAGMVALTFNGCNDETECPTCNEPPSITEQQFSIPENSPAGTVVDTVNAFDADPDQTLSFSIIGGNKNDAFGIQKKTGIISVNSPDQLDYEANPEFELIVQVTDSCEHPLSASNKVTISLTDIKPATDGLISYYEFDGNTLDLAGSNDATANDAEYIAGPSSNAHQSLLFNGSSSYVDLNNPFDLKSKTINIRFDALKIESESGIIYTSDNPNLTYGLTILLVKMLDTSPKLIYCTGNQRDTADLAEDTWYNVTVVTQEKFFEYYLDDDLLFSGVFDSYETSFNGIETALLGCLRTMDLRFFNGLVDDVWIYGRALSSDEIKLLNAEK